MAPPDRRADRRPVVTPALAPRVRSTCATAADWWRARTSAGDSASIDHRDTVLVPPLDATETPVCVMRVALPHGMRPGDSAVPASNDSVPPMLRGSGAAWRRLLHYDADGPDGTQTAYQREGIRCVEAQSWDGGDDSDSTYVPDRWYRLELTCWTAPPDTVAGPVQPWERGVAEAR